MKILWISPFLPYDNVSHAGGKILTHYINSIIENTDHDVRYVGFAKPSEYKHFSLDKKIKCYIDFYHDHGLKKLVRNAYDLYSLKCPFDRNGNTTTSYLKLCILRRLKSLKKEGYAPDVIILHWTQTIVFVNEVKKLFPSAKIVGIEEDVSAQACLRKYENAKGSMHKVITKMRYDRIKQSECKALNKCDLVILNNEKDRKMLKDFGISSSVKVWSPYYDRITVKRDAEPKKNILFYGDMSRPENYRPALWLIDEVFPLIEDIGLKLVILGGHPTKELLDRASDKVIITGFVEDIEPYLSSSLCLAAPLVLGAGIKIKVLTCMAAGIPVCTNDVGIEGIPADTGKHYIYCKDKNEYADAIKKLYEDNRFAEDIVANARKLIDEKFDYYKSSEDFAKWLQDLV
ncbi:glycosyltransferase [Butyrivibrio sp. INlla21]|uniref:glycosyltransferase n=1 Tax=Butyrivibrio sp. INlla21 TaxID=1520811 RepID=UPI0008E795F6|nr:glycosyltransferase [Butyrivibrio sp. INlla21]SFV03119.1 Glycosyltransferase involved in cell wall bisynthesis [Butyrivibrio sp. INlla21]